jgi:hypothetical protein
MTPQETIDKFWELTEHDPFLVGVGWISEGLLLSASKHDSTGVFLVTVTETEVTRHWVPQPYNTKGYDPKNPAKWLTKHIAQEATRKQRQTAHLARQEAERRARLEKLR